MTLSILKIIVTLLTLLILYLYYKYKNNYLKEEFNSGYKKCNTLGIIPTEMDCPVLSDNISNLINFSTPSFIKPSSIKPSTIKLEKNSTKCKLNNSDWDRECRILKGNKPSYNSIVPSQETWGQKSLYKGGSGCVIGENRAVCDKGYSSGEKLAKNSTKCYLWTDNYNKHCQTDYGKDWVLDTQASTLKRLKVNDKGADYGKYKGGCITGQGRGVCIKNQI